MKAIHANARYVCPRCRMVRYVLRTASSCDCPHGRLCPRQPYCVKSLGYNMPRATYSAKPGQMSRYSIEDMAGYFEKKRKVHGGEVLADNQAVAFVRQDKGWRLWLFERIEDHQPAEDVL